MLHIAPTDYVTCCFLRTVWKIRAFFRCEKFESRFASINLLNSTLMNVTKMNVTVPYIFSNALCRLRMIRALTRYTLKIGTAFNFPLWEDWKRILKLLWIYWSDFEASIGLLNQDSFACHENYSYLPEIYGTCTIVKGLAGIRLSICFSICFWGRTS